ncbi:MAG: clostripain-related cysteine peptidase [Lentisphaerota bacterium]
MNFVKKISVFLTILACVLTCTYSLADSKKTAEYTLVIYLNGSDLESKDSEATDALKILMESKFKDDKLNIIIITGGTKKWHLKKPTISNKQCQAWRIYGESEDSIELVKETDPSMKMMDKNTLSTYMEWAIKEYPAKKYVLMMWDHGAGPIGGFGSDELNKGKSLSITDIRESLKKSLGEKKLELLIFGCCLMGNMETAYKVKDNARYMVASEELAYGDFDKDFIEKLDAKPSMSGNELGKLYIDSHFKNYEKGRFYTFSLLDLSKIEQIKQNWEVIIKELTEKLKEKHDKAGFYMYRFLAIARAYSESYDSFSRETDGLVDMSDLAMNIMAICKINTDELRRSIGNAVLYNKTGNRSDSKGLSIFFIDRKLEEALGLEDNLQKYSQSSFSKGYYDFITNYYNKLFVQDPTILIGDITFTQRAITDLNPYSYPPKYLIKIDEPDAVLVNQIFFVIGKLEGDNNNFKALSIDKDISLNEGGSISAVVTGKQYCVDGEPIPIYWEGDILRPKKPGDSPLGFFAIKHKDEIKFLAVKELVNTKDSSKNTAQIIGMWNSKDYNGNIVPSISSLNDPPTKGEKITILYKILGKYVDGSEVTLGNYNLSKSSLESGEYVGAFYIEDIIGRKMWSYRKAFKIDNNIEIKDSKKQTSDVMSDNQAL